MINLNKNGFKELINSRKSRDGELQQNKSSNVKMSI